MSTSRPPAPASCPHDGHDPGRQRTAPDPVPAGAAVERRADGSWHIHGYVEAQAFLRAEGSRQAGFGAQRLARTPKAMRDPILYLEGEDHRRQRSDTARFFTPTTTSRNYRALMEGLSERLVGELVRRRRADLSELSRELAVEVAARVVGLTDSRLPGMARRIESFFRQLPEGTPGWRRLLGELQNQGRVLRFFLLDVRPAIAARRGRPAEDVIGHLVAKGYRGVEVLTECVTFAAAGMVTTREFIVVAAWHLLENPELRRRYLVADEAERHAILHELLRLEPVVGDIQRTVEREIVVESRDGAVTIPAGAHVAVHVHATNLDPDAFGADAPRVCPERSLPRGVQPQGMSFGDGPHRCPGAYVAIQESDIFLQRLLALEGLRLVRPPAVGYSELVRGFELRGMVVEVG